MSQFIYSCCIAGSAYMANLQLSAAHQLLKKATLLCVARKIKATIDQKPQLGHNEMCHVNSLIEA